MRRLDIQTEPSSFRHSRKVRGQHRTDTKKAKDFAKADQIRNQLAERGITIIDTPQGVVWKRN